MIKSVCYHQEIWRIIFCSDIKGKQKENEDDIDFMMNILNVDKSALFALTKIGTKSLMAGRK